MELNSDKLPNAITTLSSAVTGINEINFFVDNSVKVNITVTPFSKKVDDESERGHFGWVNITDKHIPYIIREENKYCAVRIVETKVLDKFFNSLHQDIYKEVRIKSYYVTNAEVNLLNEINFLHSDSQFGNKQFTVLDLIVRVSDVIELSNYLKMCYSILSKQKTKLDRCGFIIINKENVVPYTVHLGEKHVPLFYFEDESNSLELSVKMVDGWDLAYLKFCCKIQGIKEELFNHKSLAVVSVSNIKKCFPPDTLINNCWPTKLTGYKLLRPENRQAPRQWIDRPTGTPVSPIYKVPTPQTKTEVTVQSPNFFHENQQYVFSQPNISNVIVRSMYNNPV